mmetsp:Transcript_59541/g.160448  ORF Transcript_59541/g.160448 Transcript_59541/m.160448 type:complete len:316 (-) Transcript_59541:475-1422(-)
MAPSHRRRRCCRPRLSAPASVSRTPSTLFPSTTTTTTTASARSRGEVQLGQLTRQGQSVVAAMWTVFELIGPIAAPSLAVQRPHDGADHGGRGVRVAAHVDGDLQRLPGVAVVPADGPQHARRHVHARDLEAHAARRTLESGTVHQLLQALKRGIPALAFGLRERLGQTLQNLPHGLCLTPPGRVLKEGLDAEVLDSSPQCEGHGRRLHGGEVHGLGVPVGGEADGLDCSSQCLPISISACHTQRGDPHRAAIREGADGEGEVRREARDGGRGAIQDRLHGHLCRRRDSSVHLVVPPELRTTPCNMLGVNSFALR